MKNYKITILVALAWIIIAQLALYAALNGWIMNPWLQVNFFGFALFGWVLIIVAAGYESWLEDNRK